MNKIFLAAFSFALGVIGAYVVIDPIKNIDEARRIIMAEYLASYCSVDYSQSPEYRAAKTALLSRLTIKTGIGETALVEYTKCKAGL